jgi:prephenate dehydrogenase (EC 1.3.1.12)
MDLLVVGGGTMGRWIGSVLGEISRVSAVAVTDTDETTAREAATAVGGRVANPTERFDAVCIAVPIPAAEAAIAAHAPRAQEAVFDLTGTMERPVAAMREHAPNHERLSLHPLFAPANEPGNIPAVVDSDGPVSQRVRELLADRGNNVFETTATEHDRAMETVQARTHAAVLAYATAAEPVSEKFHTPVSERLTAIADGLLDGTPRVYADIQAAFDGAEDVAAAAEQIATADPEHFEQLYERAGRDRPRDG